MKIGIITQPLRNNYGGLLQNYALQTILKQAGHDATTIDWSWNTKRNARIIFSTIARFLLHHITIGHVAKVKNKYYPTDDEDEIIHKNVYAFRKKYISSTNKIENPRKYAEVAHDLRCDAYIVGSDQCWRPRYNHGFIPNMYLAFTKDCNVKRISYATSFGTDKWEYNENMTKICSMLAEKFDLITVREESGIKLCKEYLGVEAKHVLDPTMLLDKEDYIRLIESENEPKSNGNLFYYILDPADKTRSFIESVAQRKNLAPFMVLPKYKEEYRTKQNVKECIEDCVYPSVTAWLRAFMDAEMTIVDSFHGMVFSIIFNKPFWVIGNKTRGMSRFHSLLQQFGLQDRLLDVNELNNVDLNKHIDWERVNAKREALKQESLSLLFNALNS